MIRWLGGGVLAAWLLLPMRTDACSLVCTEYSASPFSVPANIAAIPVPGNSARLFRADDGGLVATTAISDAVFSRLLVPAAPLDPDAGYFLEFDSICGDDAGVRSEFSTGPAAALPAALGAVVVGEPRVGALTTWTYCGSCTAEIKAARRTVSMTLPADFLPWAAASRFTLYVDGAPFPSAQAFDAEAGPTSPGEVSFLAYGRCVRQGARSLEDEGLTMGSHLAELRALIAGNPTPFVSAPVSFTLSCEGVCVEGRDGCDGGLPPCDAGVPDAGVPDAGVPDAGVPDAGVPDAGSVEAGRPDAGGDAGSAPDGGTSPAPDLPSGCGCDAAPAALALLGAMLLGRRRFRPG